MLLKNIFGILIILLNAAGLVYLGYIGVKRIRFAISESSRKTTVKKKQPKQEVEEKEEAFNEADFHKDDDLINNFDLTDFDDFDLEDLD